MNGCYKLLAIASLIASFGFIIYTPHLSADLSKPTSRVLRHERPSQRPQIPGSSDIQYLDRLSAFISRAVLIVPPGTSMQEKRIVMDVY